MSTIPVIDKLVGEIAAAPPSSSSGESWENKTFTHTTDPETGHNKTNIVTEASHTTKVNTTLVVWAVVGVLVFALVVALLAL